MTETKFYRYNVYFENNGSNIPPSEALTDDIFSDEMYVIKESSDDKKYNTKFQKIGHPTNMEY